MNNTQTFYIKNQTDYEKWIRYFSVLNYATRILANEYLVWNDVNNRMESEKLYNFYITTNHEDRTIISSYSRDKLKVLDLDYEIRKLKLNKLNKIS